ncbi:MAG: hypothetical protein IPL62_20550 [Caulobacteraceae bacterium]|nr:hypothetical protein [Caulobacteraceae bacterium]
MGKRLQARPGFLKEIRDRIQNHTLQDVTSKSYDRWSYMPEKCAAMEKRDALCGRFWRRIPDVRDGVIRRSRVTALKPTWCGELRQSRTSCSVSKALNPRRIQRITARVQAPPDVQLGINSIIARPKARRQANADQPPHRTR